MFKLLNMGDYCDYQGDEFVFSQNADGKIIMIDDNLREKETDFIIIYIPMEKHCKNKIFFENEIPDFSHLFRLINKDTNIVYHTLFENGLYLKFVEGKFSVCVEKAWGIDETSGDYLISYCTYVPEENTEDYYVYTEDIIQFISHDGERKIGKVFTQDNKFMIECNDGSIVPFFDKYDEPVTEIFILNKEDSATGEYRTTVDF